MDKGMDQIGFAAHHAMEATLQNRLTSYATRRPVSTMSTSSRNDTRLASSSSSSSSSCALSIMMNFAIFASTAGMYLWQRNQSREQITREQITSGKDDNDIIYLDYNGTTPIDSRVLDAMMPYLTTHYGNPSSSHGMGTEPRRAIDEARRSLLKLLGIDKIQPLTSIWFTGCGTESDNLAIRLALLANQSKMMKNNCCPHIVTCNVEHPAISGYLQQLQDRKEIDVTYVPVGTDGRVSAKNVIDAIEPDRTILVTLMYANNETGALQPVQEVAYACREHGILMHTDAAQAAGKVDITVSSVDNGADKKGSSSGGLGPVDMVSLVGHKIGATKGIAALYVRDNCLQENDRTAPSGGILLVGGGQEFGHRGGTENTPSIVGFGKAAELVIQHWKSRATKMESLRSQLLSKLQSLLKDGDKSHDNVKANGPIDPAHRLPNTLSVGFRNVYSGDLLKTIGSKVAASAGATCHSAGSISSVLRAMNIPEDYARGTLRLSIGPSMTSDQIDKAAMIIAEEVQNQWRKQTQLGQHDNEKTTSQ